MELRKASYLAALVFASLACAGQNLKCVSGRSELQMVVSLDSMRAPDIYKLAHRWVAKSFHNKDKVIQSEVENEMISGNGYEQPFVKISALTYGDLSYSFTMEIKDGKLRLTLLNMITATRTSSFKVEVYCCKPGGTIRANSQSQNIKENIELYAKQLVNSLLELRNKKDDW